MLTPRRYRSLLASVEVTVVSAESDHDAFQCSDSEYCPTARREESCCFNFLYYVLQAKLVTVLSEACSYSVHPSLHGMCCYCFAAPFSFLRTVSTKAESCHDSVFVDKMYILLPCPFLYTQLRKSSQELLLRRRWQAAAAYLPSRARRRLRLLSRPAQNRLRSLYFSPQRDKLYTSINSAVLRRFITGV
jgi:hypothetical protein